MMIVQHRTFRAFTLIEVLIVVIILGILAAIVIPQFADASSDAKLSALKTNLHTIRSQLQLYKMQHNDTWPALATFTAKMTAGTKADGTAGTDYGPYLLSIPDNPPTSGRFRTKYAVATEPAIAIKNCRKSVISTPRNPPRAL